MDNNLDEFLFHENHMESKNHSSANEDIKTTLVRILDSDLAKETFIGVFENLTEEEQNSVFSYNDIYKKRAQNRNDVPKTLGGAIGLLGGDRSYPRKGYVNYLIQGDKYLITPSENGMLTKEEFLKLFYMIPQKVALQICGNMKSYIERANSRTDVPKSYKGLIELLGGDSSLIDGEYVKALILGLEKQYLQSKKLQKIPLLDKKGIIKVYLSFSGPERRRIFGDMKNYIERAQTIPNMPQSYRSLIEALEGNSVCIEPDYIAALISGWGDEYFKERKQSKQKEDSILNL